MKRLLTAFLALALATSFAAAQEDSAEEAPKPRRYTVEVIVFEYAENVSIGTEIFPPDEPPSSDEEQLLDNLLTDADGVEIGADGEPIPVFTDETLADSESGDAEADDEASAREEALDRMNPVLMITDDFSLQSALDRLERLDAYEPIMHTGWTQSTLPLEESVALELPYFGEPPAGLEGSFTLYLGRYLHLIVELTLDAPESAATAANDRDARIMSFGDDRPQYETNTWPDSGAVRYRIEENRIVKNGDVRYFDHPKFGVIAKVTRVEEPEEDPESELDAGAAPLVANPGQ